MRSRIDGIILALIVAALVMLLGSASPHLSAQVAAPGTAVRCRVTGRVVSGGVPLPGVSIVVRGDGAVKAATSTDLEGTYAILFAPDAAYDVSAELPGFSPITREVTFGAAPCDRTLDLQLTLKSKDQATAPSAPEGAQRAGGRGRGGANQTAGGRGGAQGFETLNVQRKLRGVPTNALTGRRATTSVDEPVHLPKPALGASGLHGFGREHRGWVRVHDREVPEHEDQVIAETLANAVEDPQHSLTRGAFEVSVLNQLYRGVRATEQMVAGRFGRLE